MLKKLIYAFLSLCALTVAAEAQAANAPESGSRFVVHGGAVYDTKAHLTWARCSIGLRWVEGLGCVGAIQTMNFTKARSQQSGSWRLPTEHELQTLVEPNQNAGKPQPAIDTAAFPDMFMGELRTQLYWASTPDPAVGSFVYFGVGTLNDYDRATTHAVRLVKSGK